MFLLWCVSWYYNIHVYRNWGYRNTFNLRMLRRDVFLNISTQPNCFWRGQHRWQTYGGKTGGGMSWVWHKYKMVLNIGLILMYKKEKPVRERGLINWFGKQFIGRKKCFVHANRTINYLSYKDYVHLSESGSPGWVFDRITRSGGVGGLAPLNRLTTQQFSISRVILFLR